MAKAPTLTDITNIENSAAIINANWDAIQAAFENTLSIDGSTPNQMEADFDMNSNDILNAKDVSVSGTLSVAGQDINDLINGLGEGTIYNSTNRFSGDGSTTIFTLTNNPISRANTYVYVNGIYQQKNTYTVSATTLTFSEAPPIGTDNIEVVIQQSVDSLASGTFLEALNNLSDLTNVTTARANLGLGTASTSDTVDFATAAQGTLADSALQDGDSATLHTTANTYSTRSAFVADEVNHTWVVGDIVIADGYAYEYDNSTLSISDLTGWKPFGIVCPEHFGAAGDGSTDDSSAIQNALDYSGNIKLKAGTTYSVGAAITLSTGDTIYSDHNRLATIKLANTTNTDIISGDTVNNITLKNFILDGNKANQSVDTISGLYLVNTCNNIYISNVEFKDTYGHGLQFASGTANTGNLIENCRAIGVGATANSTEGTGFNGGALTTRWVNCYADDCRLNGFKAGGTFINCICINSRGGGFETGFGGTDYDYTRYIGCISKDNNGDGFRNLGRGDRLSYKNCIIEGNGVAGITFVNDVTSAIVEGCWISNNGQRYAEAGRAATVGYDGIFISQTSVDPTDITITNTRFSNADNTQEYHIFVDAAVDSIVIDDSCIFESDARNENLWFATGNAGLKTRVGKIVGHPAVIRDYTSVSTVGTGVDTLKTITIPAQTLYYDSPIRVVAKGTCSGTAGTKTIRLQIDTTSEIVNLQSAADQLSWAIEVEIYRNSGSGVMALINAYEEGSTGSFKTINLGLSYTSDMTILVTGECANAADTATLDVFLVEPI